MYRAAYDRLADAVTDINKSNRADIKDIKADVKDIKNIVSKIGSSRDTEANDPAPNPKVKAGAIPLKPKREDFELVGHWTQDKHNRI